jgi:hypothetical protein
MTIPQIGQVYEFPCDDGTTDTLTITNVTADHVWYKIAAFRFDYPMTREMWESENYKLVEEQK